MPNIPRPQRSHTSLVVLCIKSWLQAGLLREILFNKPKRHTFSGLYMWKNNSVLYHISESFTFSGLCMWTWYHFTFLNKLSLFLLWAYQLQCNYANSWPKAVIHLCWSLAFVSLFVSFIVPLAFVCFCFLLGKPRWWRWPTSHPAAPGSYFLFSDQNWWKIFIYR